MREHEVGQELLAAWALDAVDDTERTTVERAISHDPALAEEARLLRETVAALASADATPPPTELRGQVLAALSTTPQQHPAGEPSRPRVVTGTPSPTAADRSTDDPTEAVRSTDDRPAELGEDELTRTRYRRARRRDRWLAAGVVVLAMAVPTTIAVQQTQRADRAEQQEQAVSEALTRLGAELLGAQVTGGGRAIAVISPDGALFAAEGLDAPGSDKDYQLWVVGPEGADSAGVVQLRDGAVRTELGPLGQDDALALTVEPEGGSIQPTTDPVVVLPVSD